MVRTPGAARSIYFTRIAGRIAVADGLASVDEMQIGAMNHPARNPLEEIDWFGTRRRGGDGPS